MLFTSKTTALIHHRTSSKETGSRCWLVTVAPPRRPVSPIERTTCTVVQLRTEKIFQPRVLFANTLDFLFFGFSNSAINHILHFVISSLSLALYSLRRSLRRRVRTRECLRVWKLCMAVFSPHPRGKRASKKPPSLVALIQHKTLAVSYNIVYAAAQRYVAPAQ